MRARYSRIKPNDTCHCGSGLKFKRCHGVKGPPPKPPGRLLLESMLSRIALTYTADDVFGRTLTWNEAKQALGRINVESALLSMAMLNAVSSEFAGKFSGARMDGKWITPFVNYLLPPEHRRRALIHYAENANKMFLPLSPQACIAMTEACARYCDRINGLRFEQPHQSMNFAHVLFSFQGNLAEPGLFTRPYSLSQLSHQQFSSLTRGYLAANYVFDLHGAMLRHHMQFGSTEPLTRLHGISPSQWFERTTGIAPELFGLVSIFFAHLGGEFSLDQPDLTKLVFKLDVVLAEVTEQPANDFRHLVKSAELDYAELDATKSPATWDEALFGQHYIRRRPLLRLGPEAHICLHRQLMLEKFLVSTPHLLTELVAEHPPSGANPDRKRRITQLRIDLGYIFDAYVPRLLQAYFPENEARCRFAYDGPTGKERDGLIVVGGHVLLFEFVHHPWSLAERSSSTAEGYASHLQDNILKLSEVANAISTHQFLANEIHPESEIVPIVILLEPVPISEMTAETFINRLSEQEGCYLLVRGSGNILPLQLLSLTQLEAIDRFISAARGPRAVADFLASRAREPLNRMTAEPSLGQTLSAEQDRFAAHEAQQEETFKQRSPTLFRSKQRPS